MKRTRQAQKISQRFRELVEGAGDSLPDEHYAELSLLIEAGIDTALVSMTIDFLKETGFPGEVEVGARLLGIGNSSMRSGFGVFRGDHCLATSSCVNVFFDLKARRSIRPTDAMRACESVTRSGAALSRACWVRSGKSHARAYASPAGRRGRWGVHAQT